MKAEPGADIRGVDIEIIDKNTVSGSDVLSPSAVRINGIEVLIPQDAKIRIHDLSTDELVTVTLTLFARRITIAAEDDL
ncbi:hypothetical protein ACWGMA_08055 [Streptomyces asiaticus]